MTIRAVHVISGLTRGGAETFLARLTPRLTAHAIDSVVVSLTDDGELGPEIHRDGVPVISLGMAMPRPPVRELYRLARVLDAVRPDVVMTWLPHSDLIGGVVARAKGIPVVWNLRSAMAEHDPSLSHKMLVRLQGQTSRFVPERVACVSAAALEAHRSIGFDGERMQVIHNGFDTETFHPDAQVGRTVRSGLGIGPQSVVIGHVARVDPVKDHETGLRAFALFKQKRPDSVLVLCGSNTDRLPETLRRIVAEADLGPSIRFLGNRSDMPQLTNSFDVAMCSSRFEGLSNAIGEAMCCDVPGVSTDAGDARDLIGSTGAVVPVGDPVALGDALVAVLEGDRSSPRSRILERFSMDQSVDQYAALFRSVSHPRGAC